MTSFFSKKEIQELKVRHAAEVGRLKSTLVDRDRRFQEEQKRSETALSEQKAGYDAEIMKQRKKGAEATHAWKAYCDKLREEYDEYIGSKLQEERERKRQNIGLEKALAKHKKELATYKRRLGNALNTLDRKREQVAKLRAELAAFHADADQEQ